MGNVAGDQRMMNEPTTASPLAKRVRRAYAAAFKQSAGELCLRHSHVARERREVEALRLSPEQLAAKPKRDDK